MKKPQPGSWQDHTLARDLAMFTAEDWLALEAQAFLEPPPGERRAAPRAGERGPARRAAAARVSRKKAR